MIYHININLIGVNKWLYIAGVESGCHFSLKSLKKNYMYNLIYQIVAVVSPLITAPYIARVMGPENIGKYSYSESIVAYIILFTTLGTAIYGQREIAFHQGDIKKQSKIFFELLLLRIFLGLFGVIAFICLIVFYKKYRILFIIQILQLFSNILCIDWFYAGNEDFRTTMIRNLIVRIFNIACIFCFVKTNKDLYKFVLIIVSGTFWGNVSLWIHLKKFLLKIPLSNLNFRLHLRGSLSVFMAQMAASVYSMLDKTMIGIILGSDYENGYYEQAQKIEKIALTIVLALGTVIMPRISKAYSDKDNIVVKESIYQSFNYMWFIALPMMFGLIATAPSFIPWIYGSGYEKSIILLQILSILLVSIGVNNITGTQYLLATHKEKILTYTEIIGAIVNVLLNLLLIRQIASIGAAIASIMAETVIAVSQLYYMRKIINVKKVLIISWKYWVSSIVMYIVVEIIYLRFFHDPMITNTLILVISGVVTYIIGLILLQDTFFISIIKVSARKFWGGERL